MKKLLLLLTLFISSCASEKISQKSLENSQKFHDLVTKMHIENKVSNNYIFGKNEAISRFWFDENGNLVKELSLTQRKNSFMSYIPIISLFMPRTYENYEVIIIFDRKSKKIVINEFFDVIKVSSSFFCNP